MEAEITFSLRNPWRFAVLFGQTHFLSDFENAAVMSGDLLGDHFVNSQFAFGWPAFCSGSIHRLAPLNFFDFGDLGHC